MTNSAQDPARTEPDPKRFREVLGQYPTGVVAVTALAEEGPVGMIVGTFSSVSLDPPLVAFMPSKESKSWQRLQQVERYCVNVIGSDQEAVCRTLASKDPDKFSYVDWNATSNGHVRLDDAVAYVECDREQVLSIGDHDVVFARVTGLELGEPSVPLLFYQGGYGSFRPLSIAAMDNDLAVKLQSVDRVRALMDDLARARSTEVTAVTLVHDRLVLTAASGLAQTATFPSRVGQRLPFMAPLGGVFAAWGDETVRRPWIEGADDPVMTESSCQRIRERGLAIGLGHERSRKWERLGFEVSRGRASERRLRQQIANVSDDYNPRLSEVTESLEFRFAQAPVFNEHEMVELALTLWGPPGRISRDDMTLWCDDLLVTAKRATEILGGQLPADYPVASS